MAFISATKMGKELGLSYHKVNQILAKSGLYDQSSRRPTEHALANRLAEVKSTTSRFSGKSVEFNVWDFDKLKSLFQKAKRQNTPVPCHSPEDAFDRICDAFADFGHMLKIEKVLKPTPGISGEAQSAVIQAYFADPDYLGLTLLFRFMRHEEAEAAMACTLPLAEELYVAAERVNASRAKSNLTAIRTTLQWLCDKAR